MALVEHTAESLSKQFGREVPDVHVLIAKNLILGLDSHGISDILGVAVEEVEEILEDHEFKEVRLFLAAHHNQEGVAADLTWDSIEQKALKNIAKRIEFDGDLETNLKVAALANRAQRRYQAPKNKPLDAGAAGGTVNLTLTRRVVERLTNHTQERETTQQLSIMNGSASNPSFQEVDELLGATRRPRIADNYRIHATPEEFTMEDLEREMSRGAKP